MVSLTRLWWSLLFYLPGRSREHIPEEAGKGSNECIDAYPTVSQCDAENQQVAGCSEFFDFSEWNNRQAIQTETKQGWKPEQFDVTQLEMENVYEDSKYIQRACNLLASYGRSVTGDSWSYCFNPHWRCVCSCREEMLQFYLQFYALL